jgi:hypothetical protein
MTHDITFCANPLQCHKWINCQRAFLPKTESPLSFAAFWVKGEVCKMYLPKGEAK